MTMRADSRYMGAFARNGRGLRLVRVAPGPGWHFFSPTGPGSKCWDQSTAAQSWKNRKKAAHFSEKSIFSIIWIQNQNWCRCKKNWFKYERGWMVDRMTSRFKEWWHRNKQDIEIWKSLMHCIRYDCKGPQPPLNQLTMEPDCIKQRHLGSITEQTTV